MSSRGTRSGAPRPAACWPRRRAENRRPRSVLASLPAHTARLGTRASRDARTAAFREIVRETADLKDSAAAIRRHMRCELAPRANAELPVRAREVRLDGAHAHEQRGRDLAVAPACRSELRDPLLGLRQFGRSVGTEADPCALRPCGGSEQLDAGALEHFDSATESVVGVAFPLRSPGDDPLCVQRPAELDGMTELLAQPHCLRQSLRRLVEKAPRGEEQAAAPLA